MKIKTWDNLFFYIIMSLVTGLIVFLTATLYKITTAERERDIPALSYLVKCPNVPDTQVMGTHMSTTIVGSDHIHIYNKNRVIGMFPPQCVVSAQ